MATINQQTYPYRVHEDSVAGTYDGNNTTFTLKWTPLPGQAVHNASGQYLRAGVDYTTAGAVLTATVAPETGDNWVADYTTGG